jgi:hypothetical protein
MQSGVVLALWMCASYALLVIQNESKSTPPKGFQALPPTYFLTCRYRFVVFHAYIRTVASSGHAQLLLAAQLTVCYPVHKCFFLPSAFLSFYSARRRRIRRASRHPTRRDPKTQQTIDLPQTSMCNRCSQVGWKDLNSGTTSHNLFLILEPPETLLASNCRICRLFGVVSVTLIQQAPLDAYISRALSQRGCGTRTYAAC